MPDPHLHQGIGETHLTTRTSLRDIVIGMSDGLAVPFVLAAGLSGAVDDNTIILTAGIAATAAGAIAMGVAGYLARRSAMEPHDSRKEHRQHELAPGAGERALHDEFAGLGFSPETQHVIAEEMARDEQQWTDFLRKFELSPDRHDPKQAFNSALNIGGAYIVGGLVPLAPYVFTAHPSDGLRWSFCITIVCLALFGYLKSKAMGQPALAGAIRIMLTGGAAAGAAYFIAKLFSE